MKLPKRDYLENGNSFLVKQKAFFIIFKCFLLVKSIKIADTSFKVVELYTQKVTIKLKKPFFNIILLQSCSQFWTLDTVLTEYPAQAYLN